jgi:metal-responsive CopG/Arc/MetJ family transcriptional regulator
MPHPTIPNARRANFYLPQQQLDMLDDFARQTGLSRSEILRRAIDYYAHAAHALRVARAAGTNG